MAEPRLPASPEGPADTRSFPILENRTARRIAVFKRNSAEFVVIPPFGRQPVSRELQSELDLDGWLDRNLIDQLPPERPRIPDDVAGLGLMASAVVLGIPLGIWQEVVRDPGQWHWAWYWAGWVASLIAIGAVMRRKWADVREWEDEALDLLLRWPQWVRNAVGGSGRVLAWVGRGMSLLLVLAIGFAVPLVVALPELQAVAEGPDRTVRVFFVVFVGLVSTLPALLYFLFDQQQMDTVRTRFFRDVMRLDPMIQTIDDAEALYGPLLNEVYGRRRSHSGLNLAGVPLLVSTFLMALGWTITLLPAGAPPRLASSLHDFLIPNKTAFNFAFLGAYFFTLNMVFRRYVRADLGPKAYSHIAKRTIAAVVLAWIAGSLPELIGPSASGDGGLAEQAVEPAAWLLLLAFFIGIVPETGIAVYHDVRQRLPLLGTLVPSLKERDPLTRLEGITLYDRARLLEEGIENVENLAHHNLIELMLRTRIPTPRLVDLMDQALLYLHARGAAPEDDAEDARIPPTVRRLRDFGVRTATDFEDAVAAAASRSKLDAFLDLSGSENGISRLQVIQDTLQGDDWMPHLRHWRGYRIAYEQAFRLESFFNLTAASSGPEPGRSEPARVPVAPAPAAASRRAATEPGLAVAPPVG